MGQEVKDTKYSAIIGRDANGSEIKIDSNELKNFIDNQIDLHKKNKNTDNVDSEQKNKWFGIYFKIFGIVLGGAIIFWLLAIGAYYLGFKIINPEHIVLTLVGILATFVVVSNYMQVKEIKDDYVSSSKKICEQINDINNRIDLLYSNIHNNHTDIDTGEIEYKIYLYYYTIKALVDYNSRSYKTSLNSAICAIMNLNKLNKITYHSFYDPIFYIRRLTPESISENINLSNDEKMNM